MSDDQTPPERTALPKGEERRGPESKGDKGRPREREGTAASRVGLFALRALKVGWKLALVLAIIGLVVYRVRFAPVPVAAHRAKHGRIVAEVMGTGTLEARVGANISSRISGRVGQVLVDQGDRVTKGQLLVTLDDGDLRRQVEMAKAEIAATKAGIDRSGAEIARAEAAAVEARASHVRVATLQRQGIMSADDLGKATLAKDVAEAELRRSRLYKVELQRLEHKAVETLGYTQERLADTEIVSPFDALIVRRSREPGDVVVPGTSILQVISTDQMWVSAWVDESALASLAVGQPARVVFRSEPKKAYAGRVARLPPSADRETRELLVDVALTQLPKNWAVGQRAEVYIRTATKERALLVPLRALTWQKGKAGLFVSEAGRARWRQVVLGLRGENRVEVAKGLRAGETVVWVKGPKADPLTEGRAVKVP